MTVTYFPFNSNVVDGVPDRPANAENLAAYLAGFFSNGVVMQTDTALQVSASSGMNVQIAAGVGNINGKTILNDAAKIITLDAANASLARIDRVVFRLDEVNRLMEFDVLKGTPASNPAAPTLTQSADVYELCLAEIRVPAGATSIIAGYITDKRSDETLCGLVAIPPHIQGIEYGGTGATSAAAARSSLGLGDVATENILPVSKGGTGAISAIAARFNLLGYIPSTIRLYLSADLGTGSYNYFVPLPPSATSYGCKSGNLSSIEKTIATFGNRENVAVKGILIGKKINKVRVSGTMGCYSNEISGSVTLAMMIDIVKNDGTVENVTSARCAIFAEKYAYCSAGSIVEVDEGDVIYLRGYKGSASADIDVRYGYKGTQLSVEAIG